MERKRIISLLTLFTFGTVLFAQNSSDTISMHPRKFRFTYQSETIKRAKPLDEILMNEPVDMQVKSEWKKYKTAHGLGIGLEVAGVGLMAANLAQSLNGNGSSGLLLAGAGTLLSGVIINGFVATPRAKAAARRYNDVKMGRNLPVQPPMPSVLLPSGVKTPPDSTQPKPPPVASRQKRSSGYRATSTGAYYSFATGFGWSKQKINYEDAFTEDYTSARIFSYELQYGKMTSEKMGWQIGIGLTQHGFRLEDTEYDYLTGVEVDVKADARIRYLEIPFSLVFPFPLGERGFELATMPGLSLGYALSGKIVAKASGENDDRTVKTKVTDKVSFDDVEFGDRLDAALLLGLRAAYPFGPGKTFLEARYHLGVLNLERGSDGKAFNRSFLLRAGYQYAL